MWTWTPLPMPSGSGRGEKVARRPSRRATSRTTSLTIAARSAAAMPSVGATSTSHWFGPYSGSTISGSAPAWRSAAITSPAKGSATRCAARVKGPSAGPGESSTSSCSKDATSRRPVSARRSSSAWRRNERGQASHGVPSVCTASDRAKSSGATPSHRSTRTRAAGSGMRRRSPTDPHGFGSASGPKQQIAWLAGTQPTPVFSRSSKVAAGTERPRTSPARSQYAIIVSSSLGMRGSVGDVDGSGVSPVPCGA